METRVLIWLITRVYVADVTASVVHDYWSIPLTNGEGIAIDYTVTPPLLYITTDPSSPRGAPYQPLLAAFLLPEVGTGYMYPDVPWNPPDVTCDGCHTAYEEIVEGQDEFYDLVHDQEVVYSAELIAVLAVIFLPFVFVVLFVVVRKIRNYDYKNFQDVSPVTNRDEPNPWDDLFSMNQQRPVAGKVSHHYFEDEQFWLCPNPHEPNVTINILAFDFCTLQQKWVEIFVRWSRHQRGRKFSGPFFASSVLWDIMPRATTAVTREYTINLHKRLHKM